jgi:glycosyltransferase involved in cell wall biosynthesis
MEAHVRILHVSDVYAPRLGGIERQVADLAAQQRSRGHQVTVLTSTAGAAERHLLRWPSAVWRPGLALEHTAPDVVHCHSSIVSPLAWSMTKAATNRGLPTVVTMHSLVPAMGPQAVGLRVVANAVHGRAVWTAVSGVAATALHRAVGTSVHVLYNGIEPSAWSISDVGGRPVLTVVSVMRLAARKRPMALLDTLSSVHRQLDGAVPWRAVIAGSGPQQGALQRKVRRQGLQQVVSLPGRLDRAAVTELLGHADLFVAPARLESFGIAALEALCAGVPVVAVRGTGVGEFVRHDQDGQLVNGDRQMADAVAGLLRDPARLRSMAKAARSSAVAQSWSRVLERCDEMYERAAWQTARARRITGVH